MGLDFFEGNGPSVFRHNVLIHRLKIVISYKYFIFVKSSFFFLRFMV